MLGVSELHSDEHHEPVDSFLGFRVPYIDIVPLLPGRDHEPVPGNH